MDKKIDEVKEFLKDYFSQEFVLSDDVINFFETQYGVCDPTDIKEILEQDISTVKLFAFPGLEFKYSFYKLAPVYGSIDSLYDVCTYLRKNISFLRLNIDNNIFKIEVEDEFFYEFLLNLKWHIHLPEEILTLIKLFPMEIYSKIVYSLKEVDINWNDNTISFFEMFFLKFKQRNDIDILLKSILCYFSKDSSIEDVKNFLIKRIYVLKQTISSHVSTTNKINSKGLEFVLTSRIPILDIDPQKIKKEISILEEILYSMFLDIF